MNSPQSCLNPRQLTKRHGRLICSCPQGIYTLGDVEVEAIAVIRRTGWSPTAEERLDTVFTQDVVTIAIVIFIVSIRDIRRKIVDLKRRTEHRRTDGS